MGKIEGNPLHMTSRVFNYFLAILIGIILIIPSLFIALLIKLTSKGPIIHWSKRVGVNNIFFMMPKFRTMKLNTPQVATHLLNDGQSHLTPIGSFLRKSSLDEIPQLISIFRGDMNFVGPRPALFNQDDLIRLRTENSVHTLRPGITGWAQINGRDELSIPDKVGFDKEYYLKRSLWFDIKIIFLTLMKVLLRKDIKH